MFGIALDLKVEDFKRIAKTPKPILVGVFSQFLFLPFLTFLLILVLKPIPSFALGMMMVAACPGGNISNFFTQLAGGNTALSISLTAFATFICVIMTPLNLAFWASMYEPSRTLIQEISLDLFELFKTISLIMIIPLILGMLFKHRYDSLALRIHKILRPVSMLIFIAFVVIAFSKNTDHFLSTIQHIVWLVLIHNGLALLSGWSLARLFGLNPEDRKAISIETGIQNSGLGLILIFAFFNGLGGMAVIAAWWGIWHIITGMGLGLVWNKKPIFS